MFYNYDGTAVSSGRLAAGEEIPAPDQTPSRPSDGTYYYVFTGWSGYSAGMTISDNVSFTAAYEAHEIVGEPDQIITSAYVIRDGWLRRIPLGTTTAEVQSGLTPSSGITIHKGSAPATGLAGTGMTVEYTRGGEVVQTLTMVVTGDLNGDGRLDISDVVQLQGSLLGRVTLSDAAAQAADVNGNLAVLRALDATVAGRTIVYSTRNAAELGDLNGVTLVRIESESETAESGAEHFTLHIPGGLIGEKERRIAVTLTVPGIHNARNASAAIIAAALLGMDVERASAAVTSFLGAARRFQVRGTVSQVTVVDDYAHHPTEIAALLDAARRRYPQSKIRVIFQPHLFSRTRFFSSEFAQALAKADDVIVTGIFPAREKQEDFPDVTPATIVDEALKLEHEPAKDWIRGVEDMHTAAQMMVMRAHHGDVIFTVGAGDITQMDEVILHALEAHRWDCEG